MKRSLRCLTTCLLLAPAVTAGIRHVAPLDDVVSQADLIVRGAVDLGARTVAVGRVYRGEASARSVRVENLREFGPARAPFGDGVTVHPAEAVLLMQELDGRFYLVHCRTPVWITPASCIFPIAPDGRVLRYAQPINPGPLTLTVHRPSLAEFEEELMTLEATHGPRLKPPAAGFSAEELERFYALLAPYIDYYRREPTRPGEELAGWSATTTIDLAGSQALAEATDRLAGYVRSGEGRGRGIEALLILAEQRGPDQGRRRHVEAVLEKLLGDLGPEGFVEPLLREVASRDIAANKITAARLLRRVGGEAADRAQETLESLILGDDDTLASRSYFALRDLGRSAAAEAALEQRGG